VGWEREDLLRVLDLVKDVLEQRLRDGGHAGGRPGLEPHDGALVVQRGVALAPQQEVGVLRVQRDHDVEVPLHARDEEGVHVPEAEALCGGPSGEAAARFGGQRSIQGGSGAFREATRPLTEAAVRSGRHLRGELLLERREEPLELLRGEHPGRLARGEQRVHDLQEGRVRKLKVLRTRRVRLVRGEGRGVSD